MRFGPGPLFDQILPLMMISSLEESERHLLVKVIDRVLTEHDSQPGDKVEDFLEADRWATVRAIELTNS